jgi:hypothetical protein
MDNYTRIHQSLGNVIQAHQAIGKPYVVINGPLGSPLPPDDGLDAFIDSIIDAGLRHELSWRDVETILQQDYYRRNGDVYAEYYDE